MKTRGDDMFKHHNAICYSGYREFQSPIKKKYPKESEVLEDLTMLAKHFEYIRMYDPYDHAHMALKVIDHYKIPLKVMLGVEPKGEISNPNCPWGGLHTDEAIERHKKENYDQLDLLLELAKTYDKHILALSVGNESTSDWHGNLMPESSLVDHVKYLKNKTHLPITFNEGAYYWQNKCQNLAKVVDIISIHSYPVWMKVPFKDAVNYTINDYNQTVIKYPDKPVIFTEFGWPTSSNGPMIIDETNQTNQKAYLDQILIWAKKEDVLMFIFEAFDEPWKGSQALDEPEKHWGLWDVYRKPKLFAQTKYRR
jgi:exo-beta-1,3-glucanase (GH17 family)